MRLSSIATLVLVLGFSEGALATQTILEAKRTVSDYQKLREACTDATGAKRLECMTRLSSASDSYREAKTLLSANAGTSQVRIAKVN